MSTPATMGDFVLASFAPEVYADTPFTLQYFYLPVPDEKPKQFHFTLQATYPGSAKPRPISGVQTGIKDAGKDQMKIFSFIGCKLQPPKDLQVNNKGVVCKLQIDVTTSLDQGKFRKTFDPLEVRVVPKSA